MKLQLSFISILICFPILNFAQAIFSNEINGINPSNSNPFVSGQIVDPNITVSGISRSDALFSVPANNRYNAKSWKTDELKPEAYFEFILIPNSDHKIDLVSFVFTAQSSLYGPTLFAVRSSVDGFTSNLGDISESGGTVSLTAPEFQNVTFPISFRLYAWAATMGTGAFSVNDFQFNGTVSCIVPQTPQLSDVTIECNSSSFEVNWPASSNASQYFIDVASDSGFASKLTGYQHKEVSNSLSESIVANGVGATYYIRVQAANSCATSNYSTYIKATPPETIFNGSWSNGVPDLSKKVRFSSDFNVNADLKACSCQIDTDVDVHVDSGVVLKLEGGLEVQDSGSITFENDASLLQTDNSPGINSGNIVYKRITRPMNNFDYTYWSSPVSGQTLKALVPNTLPDKYYSWGETSWVGESSANEMKPPGKGYIIRTPKSGVYGGLYPETVVMPYSQPVQFVGIPNNGHYELEINESGFYNLIGNPYPSALSADAFLTANASKLKGTIYLWTHNTGVSATGYESADYAVYNFTGGVGVKGTGTASETSGVSTVAPTGYIAAGQSFFALSKGAGSVVFDNSMRVSSTGAAFDNSDFFRGVKSKSKSVEKHRVWLNLTNKGGVFKQLLVGYVKGATDGYDTAFDGEHFNANRFVDFYSINEGKDLTIQGRSLPFDTKDQIPLGYKSTIAGTFEISIDHVDGGLVSQAIFIEDKVVNRMHNLKNGPYSFTTEKGTFNDRLVLRYSDQQNSDVTLQNSSFDEGGKELRVMVNNPKITIHSFNAAIEKVMFYDLKGCLLYQKEQLNTNEFTIANFDHSNQFLIVMIQLVSGKWISKEIVF